MRTGTRDRLLPGIDGSSAPIPVRIRQTKSVIERARRQAALHDALDTILLLAVDAFFLSWQYARFPFATRDQSLLLLLAAHCIIVAHIVATRRLPRWRARRIAQTWTPRERQRFRF